MEVYDIDALGTITSQGQIKEVFDKEAIENSIIMWLTSYNTDCIRNPGRGGYLVHFLQKPMSETNKDDIRDSIVDGLYQDYELLVDLKSIDVIPNYNEKYWEINIEAFITEINDFVSVSALIKNLV